MTYDEAMGRLESRGSEKVRKQNEKQGVHQPQFGAMMGDIRALAKEIKTDPALAVELWQSGVFDAMMLATLLMKPKQLSIDDVETMLSQILSPPLCDWFGTNIAKQHPQKESRREKWMDSDHAITARMGWSLTAERIVKSPEGLAPAALLDRIEREMPEAPSEEQWTMNYCLAEIGINYPDLRERAVAIGQKIGAFRDYPTPKGCTSPFAPLWIAEMVRRKEA